MYKKDITGETFGRLKAIRPTDMRDAKGSVVWECQCSCGKRAYYSVNYLHRKGVKSCGCLFRDSRPKCTSYRKDMVEHTSLSQLAASKKRRRDNKSGCTGVTWDKSKNRWAAYITIQKRRRYLGSYTELEDAVWQRKQAEAALHDPLLKTYWEKLTDHSKQNVTGHIPSQSVP